MADGVVEMLTIEAILPNERVGAKKQLFQLLSKQAAEMTGLDEQQIFSTLLQRERLGSTGVGNGIAIPHGKLELLDRISSVFVRLNKPVDYDAVDGLPVDIVYLLLVPEDAGAEHLKALSRVARILRDQQIVDQIRRLVNPTREDIFNILNQESARDAA